MKKVLITGAAGVLGLQTLKYLLAEGKYEITALDLKNKNVYHKLKKYSKRVKVIYGDVLDRNLIEKIVVDMDIIIHFASCLPPVCNYYADIPKIIETDGTENIVRAINYYNPNCFLVYGSTTSLYTDGEGCVKNKINVRDLSPFSKAKYNSERCILKSLKKYVILRFPLVLSDLRSDNFIYSVEKDLDVETVTKEDASLATVECLNHQTEVNKKILDISDGEAGRINFKDLKNNILKVHGISNKYIAGTQLSNKDYISPYLTDSNVSNKLLNYQDDSVSTYLSRQKRRSKKRKIRKFIGKLYIKK